MTGVRVVGIDPSLASTGIAVVTVAAGVAEATLLTVGSKPRGDTLHDRLNRVHALAYRIVDLLDLDNTDLVVIEAPSLGQHRQNGTHDRAGLWWRLVALVSRAHTVEVTPAARIKYGTGRGNASKDAVLAAAIRRYPGWDIAGNDTADAAILAAMGARALGHPVESSLPQTHLAAMASVRWPAPLAHPAEHETP